MPEYLTDQYRSTDQDRILHLVENFPFATLIPADGSDVGFMPLLLDRSNGDRGVWLYGHLDLHNPFLPQLDGQRITAVFSGPNAYISPVEYESRQYPTWNYAVARLTGTSELVKDETDKLAAMVRMVDQLESANGTGYRLDERSPQALAMISRIVFFRLEVLAMDGVFKFSQEKSTEDRRRAQDSLIRKLQSRQSQVLPRLTADLETQTRSGRSAGNVRRGAQQ
ncbi:FMN-binding negative transcriptional regulator [Kribbella albertanoniae]|uniref:FMN-binding negative transcriptional regulator n=1 Tax=Kribbella albertanoniae TaxID=1266829 RepID=A0A4R4QEY4_9ACTN|nr:FMN-binding negative transcriptional regulator [Kribbella albertanoniae]TDC34171.1 FMN-binding negative transcriptional regulator [Kribbella albertanoniae]